MRSRTSLVCGSPGMMKAYSVIAKGIWRVARKTNKIRCFCLRSGVMVLQQSVRSGHCAKQQSPGEVTFTCVHSGSIEHVDRFVGMDDTSSSCKN